MNIKYYLNKIMGIGDWGLGIGDWGLGGWGQAPKPKTPNPQPKPPKKNFFKKINFK